MKDTLHGVLTNDIKGMELGIVWKYRTFILATRLRFNAMSLEGFSLKVLYVAERHCVEMHVWNADVKMQGAIDLRGLKKLHL